MWPRKWGLEASTRRPGFAQTFILRRFLAKPFIGGEAFNLRVVKDWNSFVRRHTDTFEYDAETDTVSLRPSISGTAGAGQGVQQLMTEQSGGASQTSLKSNFFEIRCNETKQNEKHDFFKIKSSKYLKVLALRASIAKELTKYLTPLFALVPEFLFGFSTAK